MVTLTVLDGLTSYIYHILQGCFIGNGENHLIAPLREKLYNGVMPVLNSAADLNGAISKDTMLSVYEKTILVVNQSLSYLSWSCLWYVIALESGMILNR